MVAIKAARIAAGLTQQQLADLLGVQRGAVSMWDAGKSFPRPSMLRQVASVLGCTVDDILPEPDTA